MPEGPFLFERVRNSQVLAFRLNEVTVKNYVNLFAEFCNILYQTDFNVFDMSIIYASVTESQHI